MTPLAGLGIWIWQLHACDGGNLAAIIARAKRCNISWIAVKAGEQRSNGQVTRDLVDKLRASGITPVAWWYCRPGAQNIAAQLDFLRKLRLDTGIDHFLCDAEIEWEQGDHRAEAAAFAPRLRMAIGDDAYLADAPWPIATAHPGWPWAQFGSVMNARMDQLYWALAKQPFATFAGRADVAWEKQPADPPRCPIASTVDMTGQHHAPVAELGAFLDRYADRPAVSIWSYQHLDADEWALLEQRASSVPPPAPTEDPLPTS